MYRPGKVHHYLVPERPFLPVGKGERREVLDVIPKVSLQLEDAFLVPYNEPAFEIVAEADVVQVHAAHCARSVVEGSRLGVEHHFRIEIDPHPFLYEFLLEEVSREAHERMIGFFGDEQMYDYSALGRLI